MIRWYVTATDADGSAGRLPAFIDPVNSEQYQGTVVAAGMVGREVLDEASARDLDLAELGEPTEEVLPHNI